MKNLKIVFLIVLIISIAPFFLLSFYIHPSADDYIYTVTQYVPEKISFIDYQIKNYLTWNGRFFSTIILSRNPLYLCGLQCYRLLPIILQLLFIHSLFYFFSAVFNKLSRLDAVIITLFFYLLYLTIVPSLPETIYWMAASVTYFLTWALLLYWLAFLVRLKEKNNKILKILTFVFAFMIIGSNELSAFLVNFVIFLVLLFEYFDKKKTNKFYLTLLLFSMAFALIVVLSPGNEVRRSYYDNSQNLTFAITNGAINVARILFYVLKNPLLIIAVLLTMVNAKRLLHSSDFLSNLKLSALFLLIAFLLLVYFFYFVSAYSMGINPPLRLHSFIIFLLLLMFLFFIVIVKREFFVINFEENQLLFIRRVLLACFFIFLITGFHRKPGKEVYIYNNFVLAVNDLIYNVKEYDKELTRRYELIEKEKKQGNKRIRVPALKNKPESIFFVDITENPDFWINQGYAEYFGIEKISIDNK